MDIYCITLLKHFMIKPDTDDQDKAEEGVLNFVKEIRKDHPDGFQLLVQRYAFNDDGPDWKDQLDFTLPGDKDV